MLIYQHLKYDFIFGNMRILVTSSTGLTGKSVVKSMATRNIQVRAMVHSSDRSEEMLRLGATETCVGDIGSHDDLISTMKGVDAVYYICPTAREDEGEIGKMAVSAAKESGVRRFIYQSVLHSIEPELPHHCRKLEVERALVDSGLTYSIVQPAPFMQNILNAKEALIHGKMFLQKFFTARDSKNLINLIDVADFADCVARIAADRQYEYSTLELCGPENLSVHDMICAIEETIGDKVDFKYITDDELRKSMYRGNISEYSIDTLLKMFRHYNNGDFCGSPFITSTILNRRPNSFSEFLKREL